MMTSANVKKVINEKFLSPFFPLLGSLQILWSMFVSVWLTAN